MNKRPFFSVCIPNYNYGSYVGLTIESVLNQTFGDFEVIIVDNASTDNSWSVIQGYASADARIKAFCNNYNIGFAPNLQRATEKATGQFVILLSSDDLMFPDALAEYHKVIESLGGSRDDIVLHSAFDQIDSDGKYVRTGFNKPGNFKIAYTDKKGVGYLSDHPIMMQHPLEAVRFAMQTNFGIAAFLSTCYSRDLWHCVEGYDLHYLIFPDKAFLFKILLREPRYVYVEKSLFAYRIHANNQNSKNAGLAALKHQMDGYLRTINFSDNDLQKIGMSRAESQFFYIKNLCEKHAFIALKMDQRLKAFKILCFAFATFPLVAVKFTRLWGLMVLLLFGRLGSWTFNLLYGMKNSISSEE